MRELESWKLRTYGVKRLVHGSRLPDEKRALIKFHRTQSKNIRKSRKKKTQKRGTLVIFKTGIHKKKLTQTGIAGVLKPKYSWLTGNQKSKKKGRIGSKISV